MLPQNSLARLGLLLLPLVFISCHSEPEDFQSYREVLTTTFNSFGALPAKLDYNEVGDLEIYYYENFQDLLDYAKLRSAAILLVDRDTALFNCEQLIFKFRTENGQYAEFPYATSTLNQAHTKSLNFVPPERFLGNTNEEEVLSNFGTTAGKMTRDGTRKGFRFLEAGFAYTEGQVITFFARGAQGANGYEGLLPNGLSFEMSKADILAHLGEPENDSDVTLKYDGGQVVIFFMNNKIHFIERYEEGLATRLKERFPNQ